MSFLFIYLKGLYETYPFKQNYGVFLNLFPLNEPQKYTGTLKGTLGKKLEVLLIYEISFEIVEVNE